MYKIFLIALLITGCTPIIVDRDFEQEEKQYIEKYGLKAKMDPFYAEPTDNNVVAGNSDNIIITINKDSDIRYHEMDIQKWQASIFNHNDNSVCVYVDWRLMDFELYTDYPGFVFVKSHDQVINFAKMHQKIWDLNGTEFVLPSSGYINNIIVKEPASNNKGDECTFEESVSEF